MRVVLVHLNEHSGDAKIAGTPVRPGISSRAAQAASGAPARVFAIESQPGRSS